VEFIPETAKLDINNLNGPRLLRLLGALGVEPGQAQAIMAGIAARKGGQALTGPFSTGPTFPGGPASFQEIEELLTVQGVTPELFYGTYVPNRTPREGEPGLVRRSGLIDCVSVYGSQGMFDASTADPAVLIALGAPEGGARMLVEERTRQPLNDIRLNALKPYMGSAAGSLAVEGHSIYTIRATARLKLADGKFSDLRRSVAAQVKFMPRDYDTWIHILRWYDTAWSN
jgi:hypothetical protein